MAINKKREYQQLTERFMKDMKESLIYNPPEFPLGNVSTHVMEPTAAEIKLKHEQAIVNINKLQGNIGIDFQELLKRFMDKYYFDKTNAEEFITEDEMRI